MDPVCPHRQGHIDSIIDKQTGMPPGTEGLDLLGQKIELPTGEIFLSELNCPDPTLKGLLDYPEESLGTG
jgi:hypothetical protein